MKVGEIMEGDMEERVVYTQPRVLDVRDKKNREVLKRKNGVYVGGTYIGPGFRYKRSVFARRESIGEPQTRYGLARYRRRIMNSSDLLDKAYDQVRGSPCVGTDDALETSPNTMNNARVLVQLVNNIVKLNDDNTLSARGIRYVLPYNRGRWPSLSLNSGQGERRRLYKIGGSLSCSSAAEAFKRAFGCKPHSMDAKRLAYSCGYRLNAIRIMIAIIAHRTLTCNNFRNEVEAIVSSCLPVYASRSEFWGGHKGCDSTDYTDLRKYEGMNVHGFITYYVFMVIVRRMTNCYTLDPLSRHLPVCSQLWTGANMVEQMLVALNFNAPKSYSIKIPVYQHDLGALCSAEPRADLFITGMELDSSSRESTPDGSGEEEEEEEEEEGEDEEEGEGEDEEERESGVEPADGTVEPLRYTPRSPSQSPPPGHTTSATTPAAATTTTTTTVTRSSISQPVCVVSVTEVPRCSYHFHQCESSTGEEERSTRPMLITDRRIVVSARGEDAPVEHAPPVDENSPSGMEVDSSSTRGPDLSRRSASNSIRDLGRTMNGSIDAYFMAATAPVKVEEGAPAVVKGEPGTSSPYCAVYPRNLDRLPLLSPSVQLPETSFELSHDGGARRTSSPVNIFSRITSSESGRRSPTRLFRRGRVSVTPTATTFTDARGNTLQYANDHNNNNNGNRNANSDYDYEDDDDDSDCAIVYYSSSEAAKTRSGQRTDQAPTTKN